MGKLAHALKQRFKSPQEALKFLGLDESLLTEDKLMARSYTLDAYEEEEQAADRGRKTYDELRQLGRDMEMTLPQLMEVALEHGNPDEIAEMAELMRGCANDARGPRAHARDRGARRRLSRDEPNLAREYAREKGSAPPGLDRTRSARDVDWGPYSSERERDPIENFSQRSSEWEDRGSASDRRRAHDHAMTYDRGSDRAMASRLFGRGFDQVETGGR